MDIAENKDIKKRKVPINHQGAGLRVMNIKLAKARSVVRPKQITFKVNRRYSSNIIPFINLPIL